MDTKLFTFATALQLLLSLSQFVSLTSQQNAVGDRTKYFSRFGDCETVNELSANRHFVLNALYDHGVPMSANSCSMTFDAGGGAGICITFTELKWTECRARLNIFQSSGADGKPWEDITCHQDMPGQMCTSSEFVTIELRKEKGFNTYKGYKFSLRVEQSDSITLSDGGVVVTSLGLFVGVVVGVVVLMAVMAATFIYCCCKRKNSSDVEKTTVTSSSRTTGAVEPTAPPLLEEVDSSQRLCYPDDPPPYVCPPPYEERPSTGLLVTHGTGVKHGEVL